METSDLIGIGKLGGRDGDGYYHVMVKPSLRATVEAITDCFLIFRCDRVFYVTISDAKLSQGRWYVRFAEDGIDEERSLHKEVILAVEPEVLDSGKDDEDLDDLIGYQVIQGEAVIGTICDYFDNTAHHVLVIETIAGKELMIPYVDHYVLSVQAELRTVIVQNAGSLLELCE
ncbi:MAG: hypothetical protein FJ042_02395 [Candidatus Cloacimonetes bacterium]|nr:hypothetical protein [Candidatus Cloacimonadota bacterium]